MVREKLTSLILPVLVLLCPFVYFLQFNNYGFFSLESLILLSLTIGIGLLMGLLLMRRSWCIKVITMTLLLTVTLSFFPFFQHNLIIKSTLIVILLLCLFFIDKLKPIVITMSVVFILSCFMLPMKHQLTHVINSKREVKVNKKLPTIVHIILDEHIGINAIPQELPGGKALKKQLMEFYVDNGFDIFPNAYSHYVKTFNAIPNLLNFLPKSGNLAYFPGGIRDLQLQQNASFKLLSDAGYVFDIFQPQYINFCKGKNVTVERCYTYPVHNLNAIKSLDISTSQRAKFLMKSFLVSSSIYNFFVKGYEYYLRPSLSAISIQLPHWAWHQAQDSTVEVPETFNALAKTIIAHPKGRVYFAHILMPHSPYIFNANCQANKDINTWAMNYSLGSVSNNDSERAQHYQYYEAQLRCNYQILNDFFAKLKKANDFDNIIFIINGDHSSRITKKAPFIKNENKITWQDFQDSFATLYALRSPGGSPGINYGRKPITLLYARTIELITDQSVMEDTAENYIYLIPSDATKKTIMPEVQLSDLGAFF